MRRRIERRHRSVPQPSVGARTAGSFAVAAVPVLGLAVACLAGCASQRLESFQTFAEASRTYAEAMTTLTVEVGHAAIDADSELLLQDREVLDETERTRLYQERTAALEAYLEEIRLIREHVDLLRRYFASLETLAGAESAERIGVRAAETVGALEALHPRLEDADLGGAPIGELAGTSAPLVVASFQNAAVERELERNADTLRKSLALHRAALTALAEDARADLDVITQARAFSELARPYVGSGRVPSGWKRDRREILSTYVTLASAENAAQAAATLEETFVALVENRIEHRDFEALFADIEAMLELVEVARAATEVEE